MDSNHPQFILQYSIYKTTNQWVLQCVEHFQEPRGRKTRPPSSSASPPPKKATPKPKPPAPSPVKAVKVAKTAPVKTLGAWWTLGVFESGGNEHNPL